MAPKVALTAARQRPEKARPQKSVEQRTAEADRMLAKLGELGLSREHAGVDALMDLIERWRVEGFSENRAIKLPGLKRVAAVQLSMHPQRENGLALLYAGHV